MSILKKVGRMLEDCAKKHDEIDYRCGEEERKLLRECDIHYHPAIEYILARIKCIHDKRGKIRMKHQYNYEDYMGDYTGQYFEITVSNDYMHNRYYTLKHTYNPDAYRNRVWKNFDKWSYETANKLKCGEPAYAFNFDLDHQGLGIPINDMEEYEVICRIYNSRDGASVRNEPYHRRYNEQVEILNKEMGKIAEEYKPIVDDVLDYLKPMYQNDEIRGELTIDESTLTFKFALKNNEMLQKIAYIEQLREDSLYGMWEYEYKIRTWYYEAVEKAMNGKPIELPKLEDEVRA